MTYIRLSVFLYFILFTINLHSQSSYTIRKLPSGNYKIENDSNVLSSWTVYVRADGTLKYVNDSNPLESFTSRTNIDGSTTTRNDRNILESFTSRQNIDGSTTTRNDRNYLDSYTTRQNVDGSTTTRNDRNYLDSYTTRQNVDGTVSIRENFPNTSQSITPNSSLPQVEPQQNDYGSYSNPKPVQVRQPSKEEQEAYAAAGAAAALIVAKFGTGFGFYVGFDDNNPNVGLDLYFKRIGVGFHYSNYLIGNDIDEFGFEYDNYRNVMALNLGYILSSKNKGLMLKGSIGSWYDDYTEDGEIDIYDDGDTYFKIGLQKAFNSDYHSGLTIGAYYSNFGLGGSVGYIIPFNKSN